MKRASMLGALAIAASGFLFVAPAAHAALPGAGTYGGVTCTAFYDNNKYPKNYFYDCTGFSTERIAVFSTVSDESEDYITDYLLNEGVVYYFFDNEEDYADYFNGASYGAYDAPNGAHGFSIFEVAEPYTVIFRGQGSGGAFIAYSVNELENTTAHETGHQMDPLWGNSVFGIDAVSEDIADVYSDMMAHDIFLLNNKKSGGTWITRPPCGSGGALVNLKDPAQGGQNVCDGSSLRAGYGPGTNFEILQDVLDYHFTKYTYSWETDERWSELFAEQFSRIGGNSVPATSGNSMVAGAADAMIAAEFDCTWDLVQSLRVRADEPPAYSNNCTMTLP